MTLFRCLYATGLVLALNGQQVPMSAVVSNLGAAGKAITIHNLSSQNMTAFALTLDQKPTNGSLAHTVFYYDSVCNQSQPALAPGSQISKAFGRGSTGTSDLVFRAALFADGSSFGDPAWVARLISNRRTLEADLLRSIQQLRSYSSNASVLMVLSDFKGMEQQAKNISDKDQSIIGQVLYSSIQQRLSFNQQVTIEDPLSVRIAKLANALELRRQLLDGALSGVR